MRAMQIFRKDSLDAVKPATNISGSLYIENYKDYNIKRHNDPVVDSNKSSKTVIVTDHLEEQEYQYNHFF